MSKPTMQRVLEGDTWVWKVQVAGMIRTYKQDWQAQWAYTYAMTLYDADIPPASSSAM
jgi:hypothetical protein|tara:strand:- start:93 stop:266 length:174 start_codon:yes stop_codon:yes gene_type:complete